MAGFNHLDPPCRHAMAGTGGGDAAQARRIEFERVEIMPLRRGRHGGGALAGGKTDDLALWHRAQMGPENHVGMCGGDGGIEHLAQEAALVGHGLTAIRMEASGAGYPSYCRKRKPPQGASLAGVYGLV